MEWLQTAALFAAAVGLGRSAMSTKYDTMIAEISSTHPSAVNRAALVKAIIRIESDFNPLAHNTAGEDSRGLGQINAPTARALGCRDLATLFDPRTNIEFINRVLDDLERRGLTDPADLLAAYNAGAVRKNNQGYYMNQKYVDKGFDWFTVYGAIGVA